jgi:hypothetical protein
MPEQYGGKPIDCGLCEKDQMIDELKHLTRIVQDGHTRAEERHDVSKARLKALEQQGAGISTRVASIEGGLEAMSKFPGFSAAYQPPQAESDKTEERLFAMMEKQQQTYKWAFMILGVGTLVAIGFSAADISSIVGSG